ncbi:33653_t:CDS:2 [Gigaspora margarita]|uniref:33653_t:CDS:1 n=1 Tax=Gigaspora margarita TaxID=4874 RepID=A0ABM8VXL6_GIGMA|nr:33653_t:CDS:2 [Gigaspora margarita]
MTEIQENIEKIREFNSAISNIDRCLELASKLQSFQRFLTNMEDIKKVEEVIEIILFKIEQEKEKVIDGGAEGLKKF